MPRARYIGPYKLHIIHFNLCSNWISSSNSSSSSSNSSSSSEKDLQYAAPQAQQYFQLLYFLELFSLVLLLLPFYGSFACPRGSPWQMNRAIEPNFPACGQIGLIKIKVPNNAKGWNFFPPFLFSLFLLGLFSFCFIYTLTLLSNLLISYSVGLKKDSLWAKNTWGNSFIIEIILKLD